MYALGIVMRCGEQAAHTTRPQRRQWCRRLKKVKVLVQIGHDTAEESGCQEGRVGTEVRRCGWMIREDDEEEEEDDMVLLLCWG
jgi:hypothetical protein